MKSIFDQVVLESLKPVSIALTGLYLIFAIGHLWLPAPAKWVLGSTALATSLVLLGVHIFLRHSLLPAAWAQPVGVGVGWLALLNSSLHIYLLPEVEYFTNIVFCIIGVSLVLLSVRWMAVFGVSATVTTAGLAWHSMPPSTWFHLSFSVLTGLLLAVVAHTIRIRTYKKLQNVEMSLREAALRKREEERFRDLLEAAPDAILITDRRSRILIINEQTERTFGYTREELLGRKLEDLLPGGAVQDERAGVLGRPSQRGVRKDDSELPVEIRVGKMGGEDIGGTILIVRDISERVALQEQIHQAQKMEALGVLAGGIAHDFNNILAGIVAHSEIVSDDLAEDAASRRNLNEVFQGADRAADLVSQILTFSRHQRKEPAPLAIVPVVEEALRLLRAGLPSMVALRVDIDRRAGRVLGDPTEIHQLVMNLCTNAYQAIAPASGEIQVILGLEILSAAEAKQINLLPGPYVKLAVSDTGPGISPALRDRIFDPFFSTRREEGGSGLGLAVVHGIVSALGGTIRVESQLGEGTRFEVFVPQLDFKAYSLTVEKGTVPRGNERIVYVDDVVSLISASGELLRRWGYSVVGLTSPVEALGVFREKPGEFDLAILDVSMPEMSGLDLARKMRELRSDLPIILCTGFIGDDVVESARQQDLDLIVKPFRPREFAKRIRQVLDGRNKPSISARAAGGNGGRGETS